MIKVNNVSKKYLINKSPFTILKGLKGNLSSENYFEALKNISFSIGRGECVAIVGHNGSGKSTLLQIITGVLNATTGEVDLKGRIAAILELGSGFNPEYTGKDNIYFNAALLGLSESEITEIYDDIVLFSGLGDFIEHPIKAYSSGMTVRLAFSVIIHSKPEILIIDEALAVGDELFQKSCYDKILELKESGVTILLVTHSATSVVSFCDRAILLDLGELLSDGLPKNVINQYRRLLSIKDIKKRKQYRELLLNNKDMIAPLHGDSSESNAMWYDPNGAEINNVRIVDENDITTCFLKYGNKYSFIFDVKFSEDQDDIGFGMLFKTIEGYEISGSTSIKSKELLLQNIKKNTSVKVIFNFTCWFRKGTYFLNCACLKVGLHELEVLHKGTDVITFDVIEDPDFVTGTVGVVDSIQSEFF